MSHYRECLAEGGVCSIRAKLLRAVGEGRLLLLSLTGHKLVVRSDELQVPGDGLHFTLCHFFVSSLIDDCFVLESSSQAFVLGHDGDPSFSHAVELCCGLGGLSMGASFSGMTVLGGVDISEWAVEVYNLNHQHEAHVSDLADLRTASLLSHMTGRRSVGFFMGFPCPPFSQMGDQRGFDDARAQTLLHGLDLAYLLRASFLLLECTPMVETFAAVVEALESFSKVVGLKWQSQILHLDETWPCRRTRWWCLMVPPEINKHLSLQDLPRVPSLQTIAAILPDWPSWPTAEVDDLTWTLEEERFHEQYAILDHLVLQTSSKCPTLLHSSGHLDRGCPCGCREFGLAHQRLAKDGISAVAVPCPGNGKLRHLHPLEAGFFCTLPPNFQFPKIRAALPLVGQTAAPVQAAWMVSHFQLALQLSSGCQTEFCVKPLACHEKLQKHLIVLAHHLWPCAATQICRSVTFKLQGCGIVFEVVPGQTLEHLIGAQAELGGWGDGLLVLLNGCQLPPNTVLRNETYDIVSLGQLQLAAPWYILQFETRCWAGLLPYGITPAALLCLLGFPPGHGLSLSVNGCDTSLDQPQFLPLVGTLRPAGSFAGAGPLPVVGLSDLHIDAEASRLLRQAVPYVHFHLLSALDLSQLLTLPMNEAALKLCSLIPEDTEELFGIYCFDGHWMAFAFDRNNKVAHHYDGLYGIPHAAQFIFDTVADHWQLHRWSVQQSTLLHQDYGTHCGVIALVNLGAFLGLWTEFTEERALLWYDQLMQPRFIGLGQVDYTKAHSQLVQELPKHGVPVELLQLGLQLHSRSLALLQSREHLTPRMCGKPWKPLATTPNALFNGYNMLSSRNMLNWKGMTKKPPCWSIAKSHPRPSQWCSHQHRSLCLKVPSLALMGKHSLPLDLTPSTITREVWWLLHMIKLFGSSKTENLLPLMP